MCRPMAYDCHANGLKIVKLLKFMQCITWVHAMEFSAKGAMVSQVMLLQETLKMELDLN